MSKIARIVSPGLLLFIALFMLPGLALASPLRESQAAVNTANFAFTGLINQGAGRGTPLTGGLTIGVASSGQFRGVLNLPGYLKVPVKGTASGNDLSITFFLVDSIAEIKGQGVENSAGEYIGVFQVIAGMHQIGSGIWSALTVTNPADEMASAFVGRTMKGPDRGTMYSGALLLNRETLTGTMNLPSGAIATVKAKVYDGKIKAAINLGGGSMIYGKGKSTPLGFAGVYKGPAAGDKGYWRSFSFKFGF